MPVILAGRPIPDELQPLDHRIYQQFLAEVFTPEAIYTVQQHLHRTQEDWSILSSQNKLSILKQCQVLLFNEFIPEPACELTFGRVRFLATFHPTEWAIKFSENYFNRSLPDIMKTWLHESYHGFLHFLSLRLSTDRGEKIINAPSHINNLARQYPLDARQHHIITLADRNLLGMLDRYLTHTERQWAGLDSYYLNVEIIVEDLTELSFQKLFPHIQYRRSYRRAMEYITLRQQGVPPIKACS